MDADEFPHPSWCSPRRCTAATPPVNGQGVGAHRSAPEASGLTEVYVVQTPEGPPTVEFARQGRAMVLPTTEARWIGAAVGDLFRRTGLDVVRQAEPGS